MKPFKNNVVVQEIKKNTTSKKWTNGTKSKSTNLVSTISKKNNQQHFPIVGIGASAGGLEATEELFKYLPPKTNMAFVLVQHLDPHHESMLIDILY